MAVWLYFLGTCLVYAAALYAGWRAGGSAGRSGAVLVAVAGCILIGVYIACVLRPDIAAGIAPVEPLAFLETTGFVPPAALVFMLGARRARHKRISLGLVTLAVALSLYMVVRWVGTFAGVSGASVAVFDENGVSRQTTPETCGAAALVGLLRAHGIAATEDEMARLALTDVVGGTSEIRMLRALEVKLAGTALKPRLEKLTWDELLRDPGTCVISIRISAYEGHFVLVKKMMPEGAFIDEPAKGRLGWSKAQFIKDWTGFVIRLEQR